jgi:DNA-binding NtrC family response regulator
MNLRHGCTVSGMTDELIERLTQYDWPGNVRELRNTIERAVILAGSDWLDLEHLPPRFGEPGFAPSARPAGGVQMDLGQRRGDPQRSDQGWAEQQRTDERTVSVEVGTTVDELEKQLILKTLQSTQNNKTRAAEILGISSKTLQNKLKEYSSTAGSSE